MHIEQKEMIGENVEIINSTNKSLIGVQGQIVDETMSTFVVDTQFGEKKIMKNIIQFNMGNQKLNGKDFFGRPEERIKRYA